MKDNSNNKTELQRVKEERDSWKETALVSSDPKVMQSIELSLKQISSGQAIPLDQL